MQRKKILKETPNFNFMHSQAYIYTQNLIFIAVHFNGELFNNVRSNHCAELVCLSKSMRWHSR